MADPKPDIVTEKDQRIINAITENPEMTNQGLCAKLNITMAAFLGTARKPAFKEEMERRTIDLLEVTKYQRIHTLINGDSIQGAKLIAEIAGEVGRNSSPLESGKDKAEAIPVSTIYKDFQSGKTVRIPDLNHELRAKNPPQDDTEGLPSAEESVVVVETGRKDGSRKLKMTAQPYISAPDGKAHASAQSVSIQEALTHLDAPCKQGHRKASNDII